MTPTIQYSKAIPVLNGVAILEIIEHSDFMMNEQLNPNASKLDKRNLKNKISIVYQTKVNDKTEEILIMSKSGQEKQKIFSIHDTEDQKDMAATRFVNEKISSTLLHYHQTVLDLQSIGNENI